MKSRTASPKNAKSPAKKSESSTLKSAQKPKQKKPAAEKRAYNSVVRQQQSNNTRELIVTSGVKLVHEFPSWDWKNLTFRAVGERAGISERTVYRYFSTEQALKDAVMQQLVKESGINLDSLTLGGFTNIVGGLFQYMQSFAAKTRPIEEPSFSSVDKDRQVALLRSVVEVTPKWSEAQQQTATAALDIFWQPSTHERLLNGWNFNAEQSLATLNWLINLIERAIKEDRRPDIV